MLFTGGSRRSQGRRGGSGATPRGSQSGSTPGPVKCEGEFDIESANAQFKKEDIEEELQKKLGLTLRITDPVQVVRFVLEMNFMLSHM